MTVTSVAIALAIASCIAGLAWGARALTLGGAVAAAGIGAAAVLAGWDWAIVLVAYFVGTASLSRWRRAEREARTASMVEKSGARDAWQVLANGGVFGIAALAGLDNTSAPWVAVGAGALAASAADSWATEIGTLSSATPRSIVNWQPVPPGMSGGITLAGLLASIAGASLVATVAWLLGWGNGISIAALLGGVAGATMDSAVGGLIQARRRCPTCDALTERKIHDCGTTTVAASGVRWLDNDAVNILSTATGAAIAALLAR